MVNIITSTRLNNISYTLPSVFKDHSTKDLAKGMANYHDTDYKLVNINNINWYNLKYESTLFHDIYLTTYKDDILMYDYQGTETCMPYSNQIINSIEIND